MACVICGRSSCIKSFHSLEEQCRWDDRQSMSDDTETLKCRIQKLEQELKDIEEQRVLDESNKSIVDYDSV